MALESQNNFEEEWQKAFDDASFSPPSDMWDRIERELEDKERRPFIFFMRPSGIISGVAAALILLLGSVLFFNKNIVKNTNAINQTTKKNVEKSINQTQQTQNKVVKSIDNQTFEDSQEATLAISGNAPSSTIFSKKIAFVRESINKKLVKSIENKTQTTQSLTEVTNFSERVINASEILVKNQKTQTKNADNQGFTNANLPVNELKIVDDLKTLVYKPYKYFSSSRTLNRNKLIFETDENKVEDFVSKDSKFYIGLQSSISPFDPNMKLGGLNTIASMQADAFVKASNSPSVANPATGPNSPNSPTGIIAVSQPQNSIKPGIGTNTGIALGYKITKKWSLESGIRYLRGNSTLESNTYAFQQNGYVNTFLADYLLQNSSNYTTKTSNSVNTVVADASQFGNRYEYLMIPMQLGYEISLSKNLGFNILGGVSTDIFLQNTITNDKSLLQAESTINSSNQIYKPLNISGLGGIRANYLINKHWQATLGSSYQQSLFSIRSAKANRK